jgi:pentatricopeptide repeat protein
MQGLKFQNFKSRLDLIHRNWKRSLSLRNSGSFLENDNQIKSKIKSLNDHVSFTGTISKNILLNTIKSIKQYKKCDSDTALALIKFCDLRLIDFLPKERQNLLNNLFENVFPNLNVIYNHNHFDSYIESTISNRNSFDVFKISREMHAKNILPTMNTNNYFIKTLCESGEINIALLHLKFLIESKTISLFDLNSYKNQPQNSQELYESLLHNLNLHSNTAQDRVNANLINPVLQYYFLANNAEKAIKIFKQISTRNIKPNNITYFNLINGYIHLQEFEEAEKLFNKTKDQLLTIDKLSLFSSLDKIREKSLVETVLTSIPEQLETRERIFIISEINYFCERKLFEKAYSLLQNFFYHEFREKDPIRKDLILTKTDVTDYFCRSLVLNSTDNLESVDTLIRFADLLDKENVSTQYYLTRMIYHSFSLSNIDLSLKLISQLKSKGIRVKINHVLPLVKQEANRLEIKILSMKSQENNKIEEFPEYKSLVKIIGKIKELGCLGERSEIELDILINCLKLDSENNFKSYLNFYDLFIMLKSSKIVISDVEIFNECAYKLLRSVGNSLKRENIDEIQYYLKDFQNLIKQMSKNTIENDIQKNFYKYLKRLLDLSLGKSFDYKHSLIFNIAELLNKNGVDSVYSKLIYELLLEHYSELFKNDFKEKKELQTYLRKNFNSLFINKKLSNELMDNYNSYSKEKLEEILKNQPNNFPLIRVLLIKMLNIKTRNPIIAKRIQQLVKELPDDEITPMVCKIFNVNFAFSY